MFEGSRNHVNKSSRYIKSQLDEFTLNAEIKLYLKFATAKLMVKENRL
jgi:hypothetical protein